MNKVKDDPVKLYLVLKTKSSTTGRLLVDIHRIPAPANKETEFKYLRLLLCEGFKETGKELLVYLYMDRQFAAQEFNCLKIVVKQKVRLIVASDTKIRQAMLCRTP